MDKMGNYEGTVPPSFLSRTQPREAMESARKGLLHEGRVVAVYAPTDEGNRSGLYYEYDVLCDVGSEHHLSTRILISNCVVSSVFGGIADYSTWTPRVLRSGRFDDTADDSSRVQVQLVNGSTFGGLIVGGVPHPRGRRKADSTPQGDEVASPYFDAAYNGIRCNVDAKGQLTLTYGGKMDAAGNTTATATGTRIQLQEDGSLLLATGDDKQSLKLDRAAGEVHVDSTGLLKTSGAGVHLGGAGDAMLMGSTFRQQQAVMHTAMQTAMASLTAAGAALTAASASILAAFAPGDPTTAAPATVAGLAAAGAGITAAAAAMSSALVAFEAPAPTYLSLKNKLD